MGGKYLLILNISVISIVNKYREGKLKSTLKRECKVPEPGVKERETVAAARDKGKAPEGYIPAAR